MPNVVQISNLFVSRVEHLYYLDSLIYVKYITLGRDILPFLCNRHNQELLMIYHCRVLAIPSDMVLAVICMVILVSGITGIERFPIRRNDSRLMTGPESDSHPTTQSVGRFDTGSVRCRFHPSSLDCRAGGHC